MGSTGYAEKTIIFRGASMKNLKKKVHFRIKLKSKHLLVIMSIFCVSCIAATFSSGVTTAPLQDAAGILIVPFENSINRISSVLKGMQDRMRDKEEILSENASIFSSSSQSDFSHQIFPIKKKSSVRTKI